ncbi:MAG: hypothetical protein DRJ59_07920 [Thermoprotei archaeon]|nr:MAG: hypothetical protein DRJ59_07920 [Thermoprotei archaeon]
MLVELQRMAAELSAIERYMLMLLYASGGRVRGRLWLQKEMYALSRAFEDLREELDFEAYSYGPFSEALEESRDMMENSGLIREVERKVELTDAGARLAEFVWRQASDREREIVKGVAEFMGSLDQDELLLYTYVTYGMAERSERRDVMKRRVSIALRMLREGKVSVGLAAKLAGMPITEFVKEAVKVGIKPFEAEEAEDGDGNVEEN